MKPTDFTSHKHVATARGVQGGRVPASCPSGFQGRYTVQPGDTMFFIAQRFGVSLNSLIAANPHITDPSVIFPGDVLCVPGPPVGGRVPASCPPGFQGRYTVQPGDTMFSIAQKFGVSLDALIAANPHITDPNVIFPGDVLCVPEKLTLPCCTVMKLKIQTVPGSDPGGTVLAQLLSTNQESIGILAARLPDPEDLNDFNGYQGVIQVPEQAEITFPLLKVQDNPSLWAGIKTLAPILTLDTRILVRAYNTGTGVVGTTVLSTDLTGCRVANTTGCGC